jgi:hypothetical protein
MHIKQKNNNNEICLSGIATFKRHSLPTQPRGREEESMVYKMTNFKTDTTNNYQ